MNISHMKLKQSYECPVLKDLPWVSVFAMLWEWLLPHSVERDCRACVCLRKYTLVICISVMDIQYEIYVDVYIPVFERALCLGRSRTHECRVTPMNRTLIRVCISCSTCEMNFSCFQHKTCGSSEITFYSSTV